MSLPRVTMAVAVVVWLAIDACPCMAQRQSTSLIDRPVPGMRQADRHNPFSPRYVDMTPGGFARRSAARVGFRTYSTGGNFFYGSITPGFYGYGGGYGGGYGYGCEPVGCYGYNDCYPPPACGYGPVVAPPLVIPSESMFGLGAVMRNFGNIRASQPTPVPNVIIIGNAGDDDAVNVPRVRESNPETKARAGRFLAAGDEHFGAQRYRDANQRYRTATETAPDLVEAFFRQGQALLATNQYELAAGAFKRGMRLGPDWALADFSLGDLYGNNMLAKSTHLERLATAAEQAPEQADYLLLVALQLYFDGQQDRSQPFFARAAQMLEDATLNLDNVAGQGGGNRPAENQPLAGF